MTLGRRCLPDVHVPARCKHPRSLTCYCPLRRLSTICTLGVLSLTLVVGQSTAPSAKNPTVKALLRDFAANGKPHGRRHLESYRKAIPSSARVCAGHPDFETFTSSAYGCVEKTLGANGKPVLNLTTSSCKAVFTNKTRFDQWYAGLLARMRALVPCTPIQNGYPATRWIFFAQLCSWLSR
jgi:hypothetical protein